MSRPKREDSLADLAERLPPHSIEAEQGALGCVLLSAETARDAFSDLKEALPDSAAFYDLRHQLLYDHMEAVINDGVGHLDVITLQKSLKDAKQLDQIGGIAYLSSLADAVPSAAALPGYIEIVQREWRRRAMLRVLTECQVDLLEMQSSTAIDTMMNRIEQAVFSVNDRYAQQGTVVTLKEALGEAIDRLDNMVRGKGILSEFPTGIETLDKYTGGLWPEQLIVFGALPGWGKTSLAMTMARNLILAGKRVGFFSMEMTPVELALRTMCMDARVNLRENRTGFISEKSIISLTATAGNLAKGQMWIDGEGALDIDRLRAKARRFVARNKVQVIFVDYFQLMCCERRAHEGRVTELVEVSRGFKNLAKELKIPVVVLAQLNVDFERRGDHAPGLADIMYCKALGQDADMFGGLYLNPDRVEKEMEAQSVGNVKELPFAPINMRIVKQRNGESGVDVHLRFVKKFTLFEDGHEGKGKWHYADQEAARQEDVEPPEPDGITDEDMEQSSVFFEENEEKRRRQNLENGTK